MTLILDATIGLVCWVHYAPPLAEGNRLYLRGERYLYCIAPQKW